ncbi:MAG: ABC transporter ATP-binding protein [Chloroflexota bacterium]
MAENSSLLEIRDLHVWFKVYGGMSKVLDGVYLSVAPAEKVGLVGETGCGKTTTMRAIMGILPAKQAVIPKGEVLFKGKDVLKMKGGELQRLRSTGASMIFQDPTAALNPVFTVGQQIQDVVKYARMASKEQTAESIRAAAIRALQEVALPDPERMLNNYPLQLSGGMRQRVCIAMSIVTSRELLIADEPGTSLDVTIQDQVLRLIRDLVEKKRTSVILVSHSLGVVREMTDRVYVMYAGTIAEAAPTKELFAEPLHPYTRALMDCVPKLTGGGIAQGIPGRMPDYLHPPTGCRFSPRCTYAMPICSEAKPPFIEAAPGRQVACHLYKPGESVSKVGAQVGAGSGSQVEQREPE